MEIVIFLCFYFLSMGILYRSMNRSFDIRISSGVHKDEIDKYGTCRFRSSVELTYKNGTIDDIKIVKGTTYKQ